MVASGSDDKTIILWNKNSGNRLKILLGHNGEVYSVAFDTGDMLASGSAD
jgi:WD40 repeat protein